MSRIEKSVFIIKPEATRNSILIKKKIMNAGLEIIMQKKIQLNETLITSLYPSIKHDLLKAHIAHLCTSFCEVGVVKGPNAINKLFLIAGENTNPAECQTGTIREIFGEKKAIIFGSAKYFKNAFHRPKNIKEAQNNLEILGIKIKNTSANIGIANSGARLRKPQH